MGPTGGVLTLGIVRWMEQFMEQTSSDGHKSEAIEDALSGLRLLQREKLDYPPREQL